jgi:nuclear pore complex protein Nup93
LNGSSSCAGLQGTYRSTSPQDHYIGIDVGTGSARACIIDSTGEIKALASENIKLWQPAQGYGGSHYVRLPPSPQPPSPYPSRQLTSAFFSLFQEQSTTDIWRAIAQCVREVVATSGVAPTSIKGIGFDATCSLAVFTHDTDEPVTVTYPDFRHNPSSADPVRNVILWLDHRALAETAHINATGHGLLRYLGGKMNVEMEMPKVLWLKRHMPADLFARCKFYDLADALTHLATGTEKRSFCSAVCKQGYVPVGVDGSVKGWQEDFYRAIGLEELVEDGFKRVGGVNGVVSPFPYLFSATSRWLG